MNPSSLMDDHLLALYFLMPVVLPYVFETDSEYVD